MGTLYNFVVPLRRTSAIRDMGNWPSSSVLRSVVVGSPGSHDATTLVIVTTGKNNGVDLEQWS